MGYSKNIGHNFFTQILKIIFGVFTGVIVARTLGPEGQGYIAYILLVFNLLGGFGHFGLSSAVTYFQKKSAFDRTQIYSSNVNTLSLISLVLVGLVALARARGLLLDSYSTVYIVGGVFLMVSTIFTNHHQAWLVGDEKIIQNNNIGLIVFFLRSLAIVVFWLLGLLTPLSFFCIMVVSMLLWFIIIQLALKEKYLCLVSLPALKAEFKYGAYGWWSALFAYLLLRVDQIMIKQYLGVSELGIYSIAVIIAELMFLLPTAITSALIGRLYNLPETDNGSVLTARTIRLSFYVCLILSFVGILGSFLIPFVYGAAFARASSVTIILLPGVLFACIPRIASPWFYVQGKPHIHLWITFCTFALNLGANLILIPKMGIKGAALATTISYAGFGIWYVLQLALGEKFGFAALLKPNPEDWQIIRGLLRRN
ncbi:MAG: polysaccharide biosynthesis C-terminal domain-containing protein [Candidatus Cloacimonetes bacterium]|jgi:O-antigen/teichoic acid export membrane protein|nr:polysaccharide biosynthesis C-terminal domain-containing protein [Candidatus Cloacimonadota bacterium]MCB5287165.1 polysaccharide biosynthesis C-terminal domain-containing protein [Candidatus Cloacimonadota bacterium]MCK9184881.1 polysaccharide biosynthesis C-terminal domain-containing protein [Candidatus Cloacimonadota bacterium]MCK9583682.1 polysaccharide biosynthesis C-terminal domain-containing protein [Candidatus Cloacimonadota bacterium]MDY0229486.1 polysaccharide biosynthesis C-termin